MTCLCWITCLTLCAASTEYLELTVSSLCPSLSGMNLLVIQILLSTPTLIIIFLTKIFLREGINIFLDGFVPTENLRFREDALVFKVSENASEEDIKRMTRYD